MVGWMTGLVGLIVGTAAATAVVRYVRRTARQGDEPALDADERLTLRVRADLERHGLWSQALDVNSVDGTIYLRGRLAAERAEPVLTAVRAVPGVLEVKDELKK